MIYMSNFHCDGPAIHVYYLSDANALESASQFCLIWDSAVVELKNLHNFPSPPPSTRATSHIQSTTTIMDTQLRDEAAQDRVRAAKEFLDPSKFSYSCIMKTVF